MNLPELPFQFWSQIIATVLGGAMAAGAGMLVARYNRKNDIKDQRKIQQAKVKTFLTSILCEVESIWNFHMQDMGLILETWDETTQQPINHYWGSEQDYFTVFNNNAHMLGDVEDKQLRTQIIATYITAKSLQDMGILYNSALREYNIHLSGHHDIATEPTTASQKIKSSLMLKHSASYQNLHMKLKELISHKESGLIPLLKAAINTDLIL